MSTTALPDRVLDSRRAAQVAWSVMGHLGVRGPERRRQSCLARYAAEHLARLRAAQQCGDDPAAEREWGQAFDFLVDLHRDILAALRWSDLLDG
jgi:hypothetical protein